MTHDDECDLKLIITAAICVFLVWLSPGCNSGKVGTVESSRSVQFGTSQPAKANAPVSIDQDTAGLMAKVESLKVEVNALKQTNFKKTQWGDMTLGGAAIVLAFLLFVIAMVFANRQAKKHGYRGHHRVIP